MLNPELDNLGTPLLVAPRFRQVMFPCSTKALPKVAQPRCPVNRPCSYYYNYHRKADLRGTAVWPRQDSKKWCLVVPRELVFGQVSAART